MLPEIDGLNMRTIRKTNNVPIIVLLLRIRNLMVIGLEIGADDYVTKPFSNQNCKRKPCCVVRVRG
ncbi:MAG: hypothetical protein ACLSDG_02635 [Streptococcus thermophilus]